MGDAGVGTVLGSRDPGKVTAHLGSLRHGAQRCWCHSRPSGVVKAEGNAAAGQRSGSEPTSRAGHLQLGTFSHDPTPTPWSSSSRSDRSPRPACGGAGGGAGVSLWPPNLSRPPFLQPPQMGADAVCPWTRSTCQAGSRAHAKEGSPRPRRPLQFQSWGPGGGHRCGLRPGAGDNGHTQTLRPSPLSLPV